MTPEAVAAATSTGAPIEMSELLTGEPSSSRRLTTNVLVTSFDAPTTVNDGASTSSCRPSP